MDETARALCDILDHRDDLRLTEEEITELWKQNLHLYPPDCLSRMRQASAAQFEKIISRLENILEGRVDAL